MTALQVLKELKKEKWPELKTGEYNLPLILAAMHKFAELRQCNVSGRSEQVCSCSFVMIMRSEDDKPYCGSCGLQVDE